MGACVPKRQTRGLPFQTIPHDLLCCYPRSGTVSIRYKNYIGRVINEQTITFALTEPQITNAETLFINNFKLQASLCVLPGLETRQNTQVTCQDTAFYLLDDRSLFLVLMDGHGKEGEKVVKHCHQLIEDLYKTQKALQSVTPIQQDPFEFFSLITKTCDQALESSAVGFSSAYSGA